MEKYDLKKAFFILGFLSFLNILAWIAVYDLSRPKFLEVNFFDVGQGDAIFIETSKRQQILIDGGPDSKILDKLGKEMPFWDRSIDLIILTHPEKDHLSGLIEVLKEYKVSQILWTGVIRDFPEFEEWQKAVQKEKSIVTIAKAGEKVKAGKVFLDILYPLENSEGQKLESSNDTSIVSHLVFNNNPFLFTGDISSNAEKNLVAANPQLESDVLKVAHHGSKYSTSDYFLENVLPKLAVIQVGKNSYGHPTEDVLRRLEKFGIKTLRTDLDGDIKIISNGIDYAISNL